MWKILEVLPGIFTNSCPSNSKNCVIAFRAGFAGEPMPKFKSISGIVQESYRFGLQTGKDYKAGKRVVGPNLFLFAEGGSGPERPAAEVVANYKKLHYDFDDETVAAYMQARGVEYTPPAPKALPDFPKYEKVNPYKDTPEIVEILDVADYGEYGAVLCPCCGAKGRYVYVFRCLDGTQRGAMAGCMKKFPIKQKVWWAWQKELERRVKD